MLQVMHRVYGPTLSTAPKQRIMAINGWRQRRAALTARVAREPASPSGAAAHERTLVLWEVMCGMSSPPTVMSAPSMASCSALSRTLCLRPLLLISASAAPAHQAGTGAARQQKQQGATRRNNKAHLFEGGANGARCHLALWCTGA